MTARSAFGAWRRRRGAALAACGSANAPAHCQSPTRACAATSNAPYVCRLNGAKVLIVGCTGLAAEVRLSSVSRDIGRVPCAHYCLAVCSAHLFQQSGVSRPRPLEHGEDRSALPSATGGQERCAGGRRLGDGDRRHAVLRGFAGQLSDPRRCRSHPEVLHLSHLDAGGPLPAYAGWRVECSCWSAMLASTGSTCELLKQDLHFWLACHGAGYMPVNLAHFGT